MKQILVDGERVLGVVLEDGIQVRAKAVLSNATPKVTFLDLLPKVRGTLKLVTAVLVVLFLSSSLFSFLLSFCLLQGTLPLKFEKLISSIDYISPVTKISGKCVC